MGSLTIVANLGGEIEELVRVVFDTNILISACWKPDGLEARALSMALEEDSKITPCVTASVWAEYQEVLGRKKFASRQTSIEAVLCRLRARVLTVEAIEILAIAADEEDNRFLECASAAQAEFLITGNLRDYPSVLGPTRIVHAREFLNAVLGSAFVEA